MTLINDDCLNALKTMEDNSIDVMITDPPYQLSDTCKAMLNRESTPFCGQQSQKGFMGKEWDVLPSIDIWKECLRVLKPASFAFIMMTPRQDSLSKCINDLKEAGFNIGFTSLYWCYSSGFPKSLDVSKGIDARKGSEREITEKPVTSQAKIYDGWKGGFQPKPAVEIILVVQKPMSEKTYVDQALAHLQDDKVQKGCINVDECRIPINENDPNHRPNLSNYIYDKTKHNYTSYKIGGYMQDNGTQNSKGRYPANLIVSDNCLDTGEIKCSKYGKQTTKSINPFTPNIDYKNICIKGDFENPYYKSVGDFSRYFDLDLWFSEKLKQLPNSVQKTFPMIILPKPCKSEKNNGVESIEIKNKGYGKGFNANEKRPDGSLRKEIKTKNIHPTVKPVKLMSYLILLSTFKNEIVFDPFMGSGTTGVACKLLDREFIGIEREKEYFDLAQNRIENYKIRQYKNIDEKKNDSQLEIFETA